jgi:hypothetical protein
LRYSDCDEQPTGLEIRWTAYDGRAELRAMENTPDGYPVTLGEFANREKALGAAIDLLEHG